MPTKTQAVSSEEPNTITIDQLPPLPGSIMGVDPVGFDRYEEDRRDWWAKVLRQILESRGDSTSENQWTTGGIPKGGKDGDFHYRPDTNSIYYNKGGTWRELTSFGSESTAGSNTSLAAHLGADNPHDIDQGDVGLSNVNNTSDIDKPISTATQTALDGKAPLSHNHPWSDITSVPVLIQSQTGYSSITALTSDLALGTVATPLAIRIASQGEIQLNGTIPASYSSGSPNFIWKDNGFLRHGSPTGTIPQVLAKAVIDFNLPTSGSVTTYNTYNIQSISTIQGSTNSVHVDFSSAIQSNPIIQLTVGDSAPMTLGQWTVNATSMTTTTCKLDLIWLGSGGFPTTRPDRVSLLITD